MKINPKGFACYFLFTNRNEIESLWIFIVIPMVKSD